MVIVISVFLLIGGILFVVYPLFRPTMSKYKDNEAGREKKSTIQSILEELEIDYELGQISEDEYRELDAKYRAELN